MIRGEWYEGFSVEQAAALYSVELYKYDGPTRGNGVLVASGTGLMMAIMDHVGARYCVDFDTAKNNPRCRIADFMAMVAGHRPPLLVAGWFTSTRPEPMQAGCKLVRELGHQDRMVTYSGGGVEEIDARQYICLASFMREAAWQCGGSAH